MTNSRDETPPEILSFIHTCIDSVEQLQILMLLIERRTESWTVDSLSRELRSSAASVQKRLRDLESRHVLAEGALGPNGEARFLARSPEVEQMALQLFDLFRQRPHRVIAQIYAQPPASIRSFADAFRIKKEDT